MMMMVVMMMMMTKMIRMEVEKTTPFCPAHSPDPGWLRPSPHSFIIPTSGQLIFIMMMMTMMTMIMMMITILMVMTMIMLHQDHLIMMKMIINIIIKNL